MTRPEITTPEALPEEASTEASLRPSRLDEFEPLFRQIVGTVQFPN